MAQNPKSGRLAVLQQLHALGCDVEGDQEMGAYLQARAHLLTALAAIEAPWGEGERELLATVLHTSEQTLLRMGESKAELARKLRALRYAQAAACTAGHAGRSPRRVI